MFFHKGLLQKTVLRTGFDIFFCVTVDTLPDTTPKSFVSPPDLELVICHMQTTTLESTP